MTISMRARIKQRGFTPKLSLTYTLYYLILLWFTVVLLLPTIWLVLASFKTNAEILSASSFFPKQIYLGGYEDALSTVGLEQFFLNSLFVSALTTLGVLLTGVLAAYPLARFDFPFKETLTLIFSLGIVVPVTSLIVPETLIIRELGLIDTKVGLSLVYIAMFFPISFLVLRAFFLSIPTEIEEAATVDGANYWTILVRLILPISTPGLSTVGVMVFIWSWNEFLYALLIISSESNRTVQIAIRFFQSQFDFNLTGMYATVTLVMVVPIIIFLVLQERVVAGLTAGAVKG